MFNQPVSYVPHKNTYGKNQAERTFLNKTLEMAVYTQKIRVTVQNSKFAMLENLTQVSRVQ